MARKTTTKKSDGKTVEALKHEKATRRRVVIALGTSALAPLATFGQQQSTKVWRIGILALVSQTVAQSGDRYGSLIAGLRELGYIEGRNIAIEWRYADGVYDRLPELAAELAKSNVDVIVTNATPGARAAQHATTTIPIVALAVGDPVGSGLVASLARPGSNVTGLSTMGEDVYGKRLEMLSTVAPKAVSIAVLINPNNAIAQRILPVLQAAAKQLNRRLQIVNAGTVNELKAGFSQMAREHAGAVLVEYEPFLSTQNALIAELAASQMLPSIQGERLYVEAGGLMSYGAASGEYYRRGATYVDKILKGAKPGDLPMEQPTRFELAINMKTAKMLGLKIPNSILVLATKVIE